MRTNGARYGLVSRGLHWSVALLIIGLLWLGWYMADLSYYDRWSNVSLDWHKALGMLALLAGILKISWALGSHAPAPPPSRARWERLSAHAMNLTLFAMMVAIPTTGYVISTSAGDGIAIFGWFVVPALLPESEALRDLAIELHYYFAYGTAALVLVHVMAALKHQFIDSDGTLSRMI